MKQAYNLFSKVYNEEWGHWTNRVFPLVERHVLQYLRSGDSFLDLCCGTGQMAKALCERGFKVTGIDLAEEMLAYAKKNAPEATFLVADARSFSLEEESFAAVGCFYDSLNHLLSEEELRQAFSNVYRVLAKDGFFLFDLNMEEGYLQRWRSFHIDKEEYVCVVRSHYEQAEKLATMKVIMFQKEGELWSREDLVFTQRCYEPDAVVKLLNEAGFAKVEPFQQEGFQGRLFFLCRK